MRRSLLSLAAASAFLLGTGLASAQTTTTTTTWTNDQGTAITEYSTTKKYSSFNDPTLKPDVGMALPDYRHPVPAARDDEDPGSRPVQLQHRQRAPRGRGAHDPQGRPYLGVIGRPELPCSRPDRELETGPARCRLGGSDLDAARDLNP